ncbi:hypothetical protein DRJ17_07395, partial [Candidatus Woesearchaeota archaeon]
MKETVDIQVIGAEELQALNESIQSTVRSLNALSQSLVRLSTNLSRQLEQTGKGASQLTRSVQQAAETTERLQQQTRQTERSLQQVDRAVKETSNSFRRYRMALVAAGTALALILPRTRLGQQLFNELSRSASATERQIARLATTV